MLHGRDEERAHLAELLERSSQGRAGALLIRGGAGTGKSALLDDTAQQAASSTRPFQVLHTVGLRSESRLAFAGLHRLVRPLLSVATALPDPQQRALRAAFGECEGDRSDAFLVGLAALGLLTEAADASPVLCLVDDLQWLDAASADALLFAARRLLAEPVAMVFAAREDEPGFGVPGDIPALTIGGLARDALRDLLVELTGQTPAEEVLADLAVRTGGNPLAVVELPSGLTPRHLDGTVPLPRELALTERVERVFLERCRTLSAAGQSLMLLASADDAVPSSVLRAAAAHLALPDVIDEVEASGLLRMDGDVVRVRHPLVRSAVYQSATTSSRRAAHAALARAVGNQDRDRYAWHRAAEVDGPDGEVAALLHAVGERAEGRRGYLAASTAYERAAQLSGDAPTRARRLFLAARCAYRAGQLQRTAQILAPARPLADDRVLRADIDRLQGRVEVVAGSAVVAHRIFITAARDVAAADPTRALEMAAAAGVLRSHAVDSATVLEPGTLSTAPQEGDPPRVRCLKVLLRSTELEARREWGAALATLHSVLDGVVATEDRDVWANVANLALHLGDDATHRSLFMTMASAARAEGAVMDVLYALNRLTLSQYAAGDWAAARSSAEESLSLARSTGQPPQTALPLSMLTLLAAHQGRTDYPTLLEQSVHSSENNRLGVMEEPVRDLQRWARAVQGGTAGDAVASIHSFDQMRTQALVRLAATARVAAAVRAGETDRAERWTEELDVFWQATGSPAAGAAGHFGRALLRTDDASDLHFRAALDLHRDAARPFDRAQVQLAFGERLRREGRRVEARAHLRQAMETFVDLRADPFSRRASTELRASGESARRRDPSTLTQLTPTELQVARLVAQGLTNKEVAEQCWVSPRTVAFHLRNVFTKTGITSRTRLVQLDLR